MHMDGGGKEKKNGATWMYNRVATVGGVFFFCPARKSFLDEMYPFFFFLI